jgi:hypothetical protein
MQGGIRSGFMRRHPDWYGLRTATRQPIRHAGDDIAYRLRCTEVPYDMRGLWFMARFPVIVEACASRYAS